MLYFLTFAYFVSDFFYEHKTKDSLIFFDKAVFCLFIIYPDVSIV